MIVPYLLKHSFFRLTHHSIFQNAKWKPIATVEPTANVTYGNLLEQEYIAAEVHSLYKAFCLGMRHQSKTPYWTRKLETNQLESLRKKIIDQSDL